MGMLDEAHAVGLFDAHCHPTEIMAETKRIPSMKARVLTIMASRAQDQELVETLADQHRILDSHHLPGKDESSSVIPSFGWHPWMSYQLYDDRGETKMVDIREHYKSVLTPTPDEDFIASLPEPQSLSDFLRATETRLERFAPSLVGEVGLDRAFRVPYIDSNRPDGPGEAGESDSDGKCQCTPGSREDRPLSPYRVSLDHQRLVLKAQLELAAKLERAVSVHSVATHGAVFDVLQSLWKGCEKPSKKEKKKLEQENAQTRLREHETSKKKAPYPPRICMHSYSGPPDALKQFLGSKVPADIFFSFSELVNFGSHNSQKAIETIKAVPDDKILIESDLHCAGDTMDELLEKIFVRVCELKGWSAEAGAKQLRANWERFVFGQEAQVSDST